METTQKQNKTSRYGVSDYCRNERMYTEEVEPRMRELLKLSVPFDWDKYDGKEFDARWKRQRELIDELEEHAFNARSMTGRVIYFPMADSHAVYLVTKVNKTTCRLHWLDIGDGWEDARLGREGSLDINFVHSEICHRDNMKALFSKRNAS